MQVSSFMMMMKPRNRGQTKGIQASAATAATMVLAIILSADSRSPLPDNISSNLDGFNITLAVVGIVVYSAMRKFKSIELTSDF